MLKKYFIRIVLGLDIMAVSGCRTSSIQDSAIAPPNLHGEPGIDKELVAVQKLWVDPVLLQLKDSFSQDEQILDLLMRAEVVARHRPHARRDTAVAYNEGKTPHVEIDLEYVDTSLEYSAASTYIALAEPSAKERVERHALELSEEVDPSSPRRRLFKQIPIDEWLEYDPVRIGIFDGLFSATSFDVTAWAILHEVGHHALGHLAAKSTPIVEQRHELEADRWAFDAMRRAGMTTFYVGSYLASRHAFELAEHTVWGRPDKSLYPTWGERLAAYEGRLSAGGEPEGLLGRDDITIALFPLKPTEESARFGLAYLLFGLKEGEIGMTVLGSVLSSKGIELEHISVLPTIRRDGAIRVFERSGPGVTIVELAFFDDGFTLVDMSIRVQSPEGKLVQETQGIAWQTNASHALFGMYIDEMPAWALGHDTKLNYAIMSGLSASDAEEFVSSLWAIQQSRMRPLLDFHEGKISVEELRAEHRHTKQDAIQRQAILRAKVGEKVWKRFFDLETPKGKMAKCMLERELIECMEEYSAAFDEAVGTQD